MLFNVERDAGHWLTAYLVLDDFSAAPRIRMRLNGRETIVEANEAREALVQAGRHETGRCGFRLVKRDHPDIEAPDLELRDAASDVLIYRRKPPGAIERKIVRFETHLIPLWRFDAALGRHFQYDMSQVERFGRETCSQIFLLHDIKSQYFSGRLLYSNFAPFIDKGYATWICVQRPYMELAERLLFLKSVRRVGSTLLNERDGMSLRPVIDFAEALETNDPKALKRGLRAMSAEVAAKLSNPLTRQLTTAEPDEMPGGGAVAAALDMLSGCQLIGFRHDLAGFSTAAAEFLGLPPEEAPPAPGAFPVVEALAHAIEESGEAESILEKDLELFYYIDKAERSALEKAST